MLPDQARAIINAETTAHGLLLETLWQSGGRITEVLRLRPCDLDQREGALRVQNLKQHEPARQREPRTDVYSQRPAQIDRDFQTCRLISNTSVAPSISHWCNASRISAASTTSTPL